MSRAKKEGPSKVPSRARIWTFTINNPDEKMESHLSHPKFLSSVQTMTWQMEEGEEKNTPHIQGVVQFKNQMSFEVVKKKLPNAHIEICRNFPASKIYCTKEAGRLKGPFSYPVKRQKLTSDEISKYWKQELCPSYVKREPNYYYN